MTQTIIALDFPNIQQTKDFLNQFDEPLFVKVGMELYLQQGPKILDILTQNHHRIFLDLKLHDIPNTIYHAMKGLAQFNIDMINVHASGGQEMMIAAKDGLLAGSTGENIPQLIAVTQLTSTSPQQLVTEQLVTVPMTDSVLHYAKLAQQSGLDGVVCAVSEVAQIKQLCGDDFLKVTPGIRLSSHSSDDQVRIATPTIAKLTGSTHIVVGRPITQAVDPKVAYQTIQQLLED